MMLFNFFEMVAVEKIGWVILHSSWQLLVIGMLYATAKLICRAPNTRYWIGIGCLAAATVAPAITFLTLDSFVDHRAPVNVAQLQQIVEPVALPPEFITNSEAPSIESSTAPLANTPATPYGSSNVSSQPSEVGSEPVPKVERTAAAAPPVRQPASLASLLRPATPWLVLSWLVGVVLLSFRPIFGWHFANKARSTGISPVPQRISNAVKRIADQLGVKNPVAIYESTLATVPMVVGYLKPVILLPASAITCLSAMELESILRHEIAHIRRHDTIINFVQTFVETVLFYHPCVWWISHQVRIERENCCDDLAADNQKEAISLARALLRLEEARIASHAVVASNGGDLKSRVNRLVEKSHRSRTKQTRRSGISVAVATLTLAATITSVLAFANLNRNTNSNDKIEFTQVVLKSFQRHHDSRQFKSDDSEQIVRLLKHFPEAGANKEGESPLAYQYDFELAFSNEDGDRMTIGVAMMMERWSEGNGDWPLTNPAGLEALLDELAAEYAKDSAMEHGRNASLESFQTLEQLKGISQDALRLQFNGDPYEFQSEWARTIADRFPDLQELDLVECRSLDSDAFQAISELRQLKALRIKFAERLPVAAADFLPQLDQLEILDISYAENWTCDEVVVQIAKLPKLQTLILLRHSAKGITEKALDDFAAMPKLRDVFLTRQHPISKTTPPEEARYTIHVVPDRPSSDYYSGRYSRSIERELDDKIKELGGIFSSSDFNSQAYMEFADAVLQLKPDRRVELLQKWASTSNDQVILLCRMLFQAKAGGKFRRPRLGEPFFLGTSDKRAWPLEPIALVDNVPFLVVKGYILGGLAEPADSYLAYCLESCDWTTQNYQGSTQKKLAFALSKIPNRAFLDNEAMAFLQQQIRTRPISELENEAYQLGSWDDYSNQQRKVQFSSRDYMNVADGLMKMSEEDRIRHLERWSWIPELNDPVIVLCRMLFQARADREFRRPWLGGPVFLSGDASQWPLEPIAVVGNMPVTVVSGYDLAGQAEPASAYLDDCLSNCDWTSRDYSDFNLESAKAVWEGLKNQGVDNPELLRKWKRQLGIPTDNLKVYEAEKARLRRDHEGEWMAISQGQVHGPFESIAEADDQVEGDERLIFRPGVDDKDVEFPLSPFIATSSSKFIQFGRQFAVDNRLSMSFDSWMTNGKSVGLHEGRADFVMLSPDGKNKVSRRAVCSSLFVDQIAITETEVRELGLERFRVPGTATYDKKHPGYKVFVKVEIEGLGIEDFLLAYVIPDEVTTIVTDPRLEEMEKIKKQLDELLEKKKQDDQDDPAFDTWKMVGTVTDPSGNPIRNAEVRMATGYATLLGGGSTTTDENGKYELEFGEGVWMEDPATQVAWCFVSHPRYVYHSNSRDIDLSMAMSRQALTPDQVRNSAFPNMKPEDIIVKGRLHQLDIVMTRPAELIATLVDESGKRLPDVGLQLDDSNQSSEVCGIDVNLVEKSDLQIGVRPEREWRFSIPGMDRRHRVQSSPVRFSKSGRYRITLVKSGDGADSALQVKSVVTAEGQDITDEIVRLDPLTLPPAGEEAQTLGRDYFSRLAEKNKRWLDPANNAAFDGVLKAQIIRNGEQESVETSNPSSLLPAHYSSLHVVAADPTKAVIRSIRIQNDAIKIAYTLNEPVRQSYGNGIAGSFNGYVSTNAYSGVLIIDQTTMTPIQHQCGDFVATFQDFKQLEDGSYVPGNIQIRGNLNCDWKFQLFEDEIYLVDELSASVGERKFLTRIEQVEVDGKKLSPIKD